MVIDLRVGLVYAMLNSLSLDKLQNSNDLSD